MMIFDFASIKRLLSTVAVNLLVITLLCFCASLQLVKADVEATPVKSKKDQSYTEMEKLEVRIFAKQLEKCFDLKDKEFLNGSIDAAALIRLVSQDTEMTEEYRRGFEKSAIDTFNKSKPKMMSLWLDYDLKILEISFAGDLPFIKVRHTSENSLFDHRKYFLKKNGESWQIVDFYSYSAGIRVSETIKKSFNDLLNPKGPKDLSLVNLTKVRQLRDRGEVEAALLLIARMPREIKESKLMLGTSLNLIQLLPESPSKQHLMSNNLKNFVRLFPKDVGAAYSHFILNIDSENFTEARKNLITIHSVVNDPYVLFYESFIDIQEEKWEDAMKKAKAFQQLEPTNEEAWDYILECANRLKKWDVIVEQLLHDKKHSGGPIEDIESVEFFEDFLKTPEAKQLMKTYYQ